MKERLRKLLRDGRTDEVVAAAVQKRRLLGVLVSITYDSERLVALRAVEAMGAAADRIAATAPEFVRNHLRRLHWLMSEESGGFCPYAPEAMAEIVRRRPRLYGEFIPLIVFYLVEMAEEDLGKFRAGILWAVGRLGPHAEQELSDVLPAVLACLKHSDSRVRGAAAWCLQRAGRAKLAVAHRPELLSDVGPVELYENGELRRTTVAELLRNGVENRS